MKTSETRKIRGVMFAHWVMGARAATSQDCSEASSKKATARPVRAMTRMPRRLQVAKYFPRMREGTRSDIQLTQACIPKLAKEPERKIRAAMSMAGPGDVLRDDPGEEANEAVEEAMGGRP